MPSEGLLMFVFVAVIALWSAMHSAVPSGPDFRGDGHMSQSVDTRFADRFRDQ